MALSIGEKHKRGAAVAAVEAELTKRFCVELPPAALKSEKVSVSSHPLSIDRNYFHLTI